MGTLIIQTKLLKIKHYGPSPGVLWFKTLKCDSFDKQDIKEMLEAIGTVVASYNQQNIRLPWVWDLTNLTNKLVRPKLLIKTKKYIDALGPQIFQTITGTALMLSNPNYIKVFNSFLYLSDPNKPVKVFGNDYVMADTWIKKASQDWLSQTIPVEQIAF